MADKDPVREKRRDDQRHHRQSSQKRGAYLTDVAPADEEEKTEQQHRIEDHFHMGHHAFCNGEDIAEKVIEEGSVVHEMHAGADDDQQNNGDDGLFAGHKQFVYRNKNNRVIMQPGCILRNSGKITNLQRKLQNLPVMKKLFYTLMAALMVLVAASCDKDKPGNDDPGNNDPGNNEEPEIVEPNPSVKTQEPTEIDAFSACLHAQIDFAGIEWSGVNYGFFWLA